MKLKNLNPNERNPRTMSSEDKEALKISLKKYGDMSGIVYNRRTKKLVGGHQRNSVLPQESKIIIEHKYKNPTEAYTVADGYVLIGDDRFR